MGAKMQWQQLMMESRLNMEVSESRIQLLDRESPGRPKGAVVGRQGCRNGLGTFSTYGCRYMSFTPLLSTPYYSGTWKGLPSISGTPDPLRRKGWCEQEKGDTQG